MRQAHTKSRWDSVGTTPGAVPVRWADKLDQNVRRDERVTRQLEEAGWTLVVVWEHEDMVSTADSIEQLVCPSARRRWRSGPDGTDRALIEVVAAERVNERFDHVVIASGDHAFIDTVVALDRMGVRCTIVSQSDRLSRRLRLAADETIELSPESEAEFGPNLRDGHHIDKDRPDAA